MNRGSGVNSRKSEAAARKREYLYRWRAENPEKYRAIRKRYYDRNRDKILAREKARYEANRQQKIWQARDQRARGYGADCELTAEQWAFCLEWWGPYCAYCQCWCEPAELQVDHVDPLSRGGAHALRNAAPACKSCNSQKKDCAPEAWLRRVEAQMQFFSAAEFSESVRACAAEWDRENVVCDEAVAA